MQKIFTLFCLIGFSLIAKAENTNPTSFIEFQKNDKDSLKLVEFTGKYMFKENALVQFVNVRIEKNELVSYDQDNTAYGFTKNANKPDSYAIADLAAEVLFIRDEKKNIVGMTVFVSGQELTSTKEVTKATK
jgi:hypothetical protein